jgi:hypothetical protein
LQPEKELKECMDKARDAVVRGTGILKDEG